MQYNDLLMASSTNAILSDISRAHLPWRGIGFGLLAAFFLSSQDAIIKLLSDDYHIVQIIFIRAAVACIIATGLIVYGGDYSILRPKRKWLAVGRIAFMLAASLAYYISLPLLDLTVYASVGLMVFIFASALSGPLLGEKTSLTDWLAVIAGLGGVIIIVNPTSSVAINLFAVALLLFGALMWALGIIFTRALGGVMPAIAILFYSSAVLLVATLITLPFVGDLWRGMDLRDFWLMVSLGFLGACGQGLAIAAYRNARMSVVIPTQHTMLLWAALFAWLLWDVAPTLRLWLGGGLIIAASLATLPKPRKLKSKK